MEYLLTMGLCLAVRLTPFPLAIRLGGWFGTLAYRLDGRHRAIAEDALAESFRDKPAGEIRAIARAVYRNLGCSVVELMRSDRYAARPLEDHFEFTGYESFEKALAKGRGVLILTGHIGNWELMALAQSIRGPSLAVVARPLDNPYIERLVSRLRTRHGNTLINKQKGMREVLGALAHGKGVGILLDQSVTKKEGVFVDFFGRPACTNKGLALMAAKTKAPVIPVFTRRIGPYRHEIVVGEELPLTDTGDKESDIKANTQAYTKAIEDFVRKYPDQWFWMHRRWKTRPEDV